MRAMASVWARRLGIAVAVALALGYVPYHLYGSSGLARYLRLKAERDALHETNLRMLAENQRLRAELDALSDGAPATPPDAEGAAHGPYGAAATPLSPSAVERAARDELGLVKPGEVVYKLEAAP